MKIKLTPKLIDSIHELLQEIFDFDQGKLIIDHLQSEFIAVKRRREHMRYWDVLMLTTICDNKKIELKILDNDYLGCLIDNTLMIGGNIPGSFCAITDLMKHHEEAERLILALVAHEDWTRHGIMGSYCTYTSMLNDTERHEYRQINQVKQTAAMIDKEEQQREQIYRIYNSSSAHLEEQDKQSVLYASEVARLSV